MDLDRRSLLHLTGATAAASTAGLAGCLGSDDGDDGDDTDANGETGGGNGDGDADLPDYADWLAAGDDALTFAALDWAGLDELEDLENDDDGMDLDELEDEDLMLAAPMIGAVAVAWGVGFGLAGSKLSRVVDVEGDALAADDAETSLEDVLLVDGAFVLRGDVDAAEVSEALTEPIDDPFASDTEYEHIDDRGEFAIYDAEAADDEFGMAAGEAVAVGESAIVFATDTDDGDAVDHVTRVLEGYTDDGDATADDDDLEWALRTAGHGHVVFGGYGDDVDEAEPTDDELENATALVSSLAFGDDGGADGDFAATFDGLDGATETELEALLGASADDVTLEFDDDRVAASASWNADNDTLQ